MKARRTTDREPRMAFSFAAADARLPLRRAGVWFAFSTLLVGPLFGETAPASPEPKAPLVGEGGAAPKAGKEVFTVIASPARKTISQASNIFHGRVNLSYVAQRDPTDQLRYDYSRLGLDGSVDRIGGSLWSLSWSGNLSYRTGPALQDSPDYRNPRLDAYRLLLQNRTLRGSLFRLGRFLPEQLPGIGYVDGLQAEARVTNAWRLGLVGGYRPTRDKLDFSQDELTQTAYTGFEFGRRQSLFYSATIGAHATIYKGELDRTALLVEQQMDLGPKLNLLASTETDFDLGEGTHTFIGHRWSRVYISAWSPITRMTTLRASADQYRSPDTMADRDFQGGFVVFDRPVWRYTGGLNQNLGWGLNADGEVTYIQAANEPHPVYWRGALSRMGLPGARYGRLSAAAYNLYEGDTNNYGGQVTLYLPLFNNQASFSATSRGRTYKFSDPNNIGFQPTSDTGWKTTGYDLRMDAYPGRHVNFYAGYTHTYAVVGVNDLFDAGLGYRW